jgi:hypothetical protein
VRAPSRIVSGLLLLSFGSTILAASPFSSGAWAVESPLHGWGSIPEPVPQTSEFVFRNSPDDLLMPVYLLGAVSKPGLYHVPNRTTLTTLLTIAGGPLADAKLGDLVLRHAGEGGQAGTGQVEKIDFEKVISSEELRNPIFLGQRDVVLVPAKEPAVSQNTLLVLTLISGIVGILASSVAIYKITQ